MSLPEDSRLAPPPNSRQQDNRAKVLIGGLCLFLAFVTILIFYQFWKPLLLGGLSSLMLHPLYVQVLKRVKRGWLAGLIICGGVVFLVLGPLFSVGSLIVTEVQAIISLTQASLPSVLERLKSVIAPFQSFMPFELNQQSALKFFADRAEGIFSSISSLTMVQASAWSDIILDIMLWLITLYFALVDAAPLRRSFESTFEVSLTRINDFLSETAALSRSIILGTFAAALAQGVIIGAAFAVAKIPGALVALAVTFVFSFVPLLGSWPLTIVGLLYGWMQSQPSAIGIMLTAGIIAGVADNLVRVWLSAGQDEGHPLVVLISILGGLSLMGATGVIFGPLFVATFQRNFAMIAVLFRRFFQGTRDLLSRDPNFLSGCVVAWSSRNSGFLANHGVNDL